MVGGKRGSSGTWPRRRPGRLLPAPVLGPHRPALALLVLLVLLPGRCPAQAPGEEEEVKETCGASYNGTYCLAGYPGRGGWAEGLIPDAASSNIYMEPGTWETCEHSSLGSCTASKYQGRWADDFVGLLELLFLDDGFKLNQGLRGTEADRPLLLPPGLLPVRPRVPAVSPPLSQGSLYSFSPLPR